MRPTDALPHPHDWCTTTVGHSVELRRGVSWSKEQEHIGPAPDRVPVIGIRNVQERLDLFELLYLSGVKPKTIKRTRVSAGWTIIVGSNGNRNRVGNAVHVLEDAPFLYASFLVGAKPRPESDLTPKYFFRWLTTEQVQAYLSASSEGTTGLNNLSNSFFKAMAVPFPRPDEQNSITRILDAVDEVIDSARRALQQAREVKRALLQHVFSEGLRGEPQVKTAVGSVPGTWQAVQASSVVKRFQYGLSAPMQKLGRVPILRMGDLQDGEVVLSDLKYVDLPETQLAPYALKRGDVLFNRTNSQEWVGKVAIYRHDLPAVFASYLIRLVPDAEKIDNYYLGQVLNTYSAQCRIKRYATPGVQQVNINATNLGKVFIPVPLGPEGLDEQREIARLLEAAGAAIRSYEPRLQALQELKRGLAHDLLTGRARTAVGSEAQVETTA